MIYNFDEAPDHFTNGSIRWHQPKGRMDVLGMGTADLDFFCPPCVKEALVKIAEENVYDYRLKPEHYYSALIEFFQRRFQQSLEEEWIDNVPGTIAAVRMALGCFAKTGDTVIIQSPHFAPLEWAVSGAGCKLILNPMKLEQGHYELDLQDFEEKIKQHRPSVFLMVNPQNPTGRVFTQKELDEMVDICNRYDVKIISDEVHFLITYDGHHHIPILNVSETARKISIQIFSLSKGFNLMSLPNAFVAIADSELRKRWLDYRQGFDFFYAYNLFSYAASEAVTGGKADQWLDELTEYLKENRDIFIEECQKRNLPITPLKPEAGYLLWIDCRKSGLKLEKIDEIFMEQAGLSINNGLEHGEAGYGFTRINFGVTRKTLMEALDRMEMIFKK